MPDPVQTASSTTTFIQWVTASTGAGISFGLNILMLVLTVVSFVLYLRQKAQYRLFFAMIQEYDVKGRLEKDTAKAKQERERTVSELQAAQRDLRERLPVEAKRAYFENMIPVVQYQIFELHKQLQRMTAELDGLGGRVELSAQPIQQILSEQVRKHVAVRRSLDSSLALLAALTGGTAAVGFVVPRPFNLAATPLAILALLVCTRTLRLWRMYYRGPKPGDSGASGKA